MNDNYFELANAIVILAVKDYRKTLCALSHHHKRISVLNEHKRLEQFFRSDWFSLLTKVDPEYLIKKLKLEVGR